MSAPSRSRSLARQHLAIWRRGAVLAMTLVTAATSPHRRRRPGGDRRRRG